MQPVEETQKDDRASVFIQSKPCSDIAKKGVVQSTKLDFARTETADIKIDDK